MAKDPIILTLRELRATSLAEAHGHAVLVRQLLLEGDLEVALDEAGKLQRRVAVAWAYDKMIKEGTLT